MVKSITSFDAGGTDDLAVRTGQHGNRRRKIVGVAEQQEEISPFRRLRRTLVRLRRPDEFSESVVSGGCVDGGKSSGPPAMGSRADACIGGHGTRFA